MIGNRSSIFLLSSARFKSSSSEFDDELEELDEVVVEGVVVLIVLSICDLATDSFRLGKLNVLCELDM